MFRQSRWNPRSQDQSECGEESLPRLWGEVPASVFEWSTAAPRQTPFPTVGATNRVLAAEIASPGLALLPRTYGNIERAHAKIDI